MSNKRYQYIFTLLIAFSITAAAVPLPVFGQTGTATAPERPYAARLAAIEELAEKRRNELGVPGVSMVIVKDDEVIYAKGLGYKDFEKQIPATADTQFAIGSSTKAFTGLSVLMTAEEGKLSLDASPRTVLPYFKMADPETDKNMTIRDLLTHSSGLHRTDLAMITGKLTRTELIQVAGEAKPIGKLRERFGYQNLMYAAAGEVVAVAQKKPWEKFVPERIFKPLGMKNSNMSIAEMEKAKDRSYGYTYNFDTKETRRLPYRPIDQVAPAGSINSSANDMAKWLQFVLAGGVIDGKRLISEESFAEWLRPHMKMNPTGTANYGLGWMIQKWNGMTVVQHGGNIDGFNALVAMIPEKKLGFVMLTNVSASSLGGDLMPLVWENILGKTETKADTPAPATGLSPPAVDSKSLVGKYDLPGGSGTVEVKDDGGKVTFNIPGQPPYELAPKPDGTFSMSPLPAAYFLSVKRDAAGKLTAVAVTQPEGTFEFKRSGEAVKPAITVDELYEKALAAAGGEAAWRRITSRVIETDMLMANQGVKATTTSWSKAPNLIATETVMIALGKEIARGWDYFDGTEGSENYTFAPESKYTGKRLEDVKLTADIHAMLDWKSKYKKIEITGSGKVGEEETWIVTFEPEKGTTFREHYSKTSFLMLRREGSIPVSTSQQQLPYTVVYSDYREVDGVKMPFHMVNDSVGQGEIITTIKSVKHNVPVDAKTFAPRKLD